MAGSGSVRMELPLSVSLYQMHGLVCVDRKGKMYYVRLLYGVIHGGSIRAESV